MWCGVSGFTQKDVYLVPFTPDPCQEITSEEWLPHVLRNLLNRFQSLEYLAFSIFCSNYHMVGVWHNDINRRGMWNKDCFCQCQSEDSFIDIQHLHFFEWGSKKCWRFFQHIKVMKNVLWWWTLSEMRMDFLQLSSWVTFYVAMAILHLLETISLPPNSNCGIIQIWRHRNGFIHFKKMYDGLKKMQLYSIM